MNRYLVFSALSLVLVGFGCGPRVGDDALERAINEELGEEGMVDFSDDTFRYEGEDGEVAIYGEDLDVPSDFPSDMAVYPGGSVIAITDSPAGSSALSLNSDDDVATVRAWYENEFASWKNTSTYEYEGGVSLDYEKDGVQISIVVSTDEASGHAALVTLLRNEAP